jgi:hypothetical protein
VPPGLGRALPGLMDLGGMLRKTRRNWPAWREAAGQRAPVTSLNRGRIGLDRRLARVRGDLGAARTIARAHGGTVNDVVLAAVAGGLRDLLLARGEPVGDLVLRASVPVSLHQEQSGRTRGSRRSWSGFRGPAAAGQCKPALRAGGVLAVLVDLPGLVQGAALLGQPSLQPGQGRLQGGLPRWPPAMAAPPPPGDDLRDLCQLRCPPRKPPVAAAGPGRAHLAPP